METVLAKTQNLMIKAEGPKTQVQFINRQVLWRQPVNYDVSVLWLLVNNVLVMKTMTWQFFTCGFLQGLNFICKVG